MSTETAAIKRQTEKIISRFGKNRDNLIPILQKVQGKLGYLPREAMLEIAAYLGIAPVEVYGVVTLYSQFRLTTSGEHPILGTAYHMKGGYITLDAWGSYKSAWLAFCLVTILGLVLVITLPSSDNAIQQPEKSEYNQVTK
jgi:NADH:ubiquinone oxidoreductase subunit E